MFLHVLKGIVLVLKEDVVPRIKEMIPNYLITKDKKSKQKQIELNKLFKAVEFRYKRFEELIEKYLNSNW